MNLRDIHTLKGIHPGIFLDSELKKRSLTKGRFAISIGEYPQTLGAITKGKRNMNVGLALKIEQALHMEEGFLMILQTFFDIKELRKKQTATHHPDLAKFRKVIFWDTDIEKIDWVKQKKTIIKRVFERGNDQEKKEITQFYGREIINQVLKNPK